MEAAAAARLLAMAGLAAMAAVPTRAQRLRLILAQAGVEAADELVRREVLAAWAVADTPSLSGWADAVASLANQNPRTAHGYTRRKLERHGSVGWNAPRLIPRGLQPSPPAIGSNPLNCGCQETSS